MSNMKVFLVLMFVFDLNPEITQFLLFNSFKTYFSELARTFYYQEHNSTLFRKKCSFFAKYICCRKIRKVSYEFKHVTVNNPDAEPNIWS